MPGCELVRDVVGYAVVGALPHMAWWPVRHMAVVRGHFLPDFLDGHRSSIDLSLALTRPSTGLFCLFLWISSR